LATPPLVAVLTANPTQPLLAGLMACVQAAVQKEKASVAVAGTATVLAAPNQVVLALSTDTNEGAVALAAKQGVGYCLRCVGRVTVRCERADGKV